jgi:poly-beta-1,6-N-acetyl-D-glucosamine synthase
MRMVLVALELLLWASLGALLWTHLGYMLFMNALLAIRRPRSNAVASGVSTLPSMTILVPVFNGEQRIAAKIRNCLDLNYPEDLLQVLVASDGSTDATVAIARACEDARVRVLSFERRRGKALATNDAMLEVTTEWVLSTDLDTVISPQFLRDLERHLADPAVGVIDGSIRCLNANESPLARHVGIYWDRESRLKQVESDLGALAFTFGNCTVVRTAAFRTLPATEDLDFTTPVDVIEQGLRVVHQRTAEVYDMAQSDLESQFNARVRMVTKNLPGTVRRLPALRGRPLVVLALISHKVLRWLTPLIMLTCLVTSALLSSLELYAVVLSLQVTCYAVAAIGAIGALFGREIPIASTAFSFLVAQAGFLLGTLNAIRNVQIQYWDPDKSRVVETPAG